MNQADSLIRLGLHPSEIVQGYELASKYALEQLEKLVADEIKDLTNPAEVSKAVQTALASKQYGNEDFLAQLVSEAIVHVMPTKNPHLFNVDNIRVVKIMGSSLSNSKVIKGMVLTVNPKEEFKRLPKPRLVFSLPY